VSHRRDPALTRLDRIFATVPLRERLQAAEQQLGAATATIADLRRDEGALQRRLHRAVLLPVRVQMLGAGSPHLGEPAPLA
jgi:hypothetical protein